MKRMLAYSMLFDDPDTADIKLVCPRVSTGDRSHGTIHVHSKVVSHLSEYFKTSKAHLPNGISSLTSYTVLRSEFLEGTPQGSQSADTSLDVAGIDEFDSDCDDDDEVLPPPVTSTDTRNDGNLLVQELEQRGSR